MVRHLPNQARRYEVLDLRLSDKHVLPIIRTATSEIASALLCIFANLQVIMKIFLIKFEIKR